MHFLVFVIVYPFFWLLSKLPLKILYLFSDVLFIIIYYVIGYRKKVVLANLKLAFPEKNLVERKQITKAFFKHFADVFVETIKIISISKKDILKRYTYTNPELVNQILSTGKSIVFANAHHTNWEWCTNAPLMFDVNFKGTYKSLENKFFDKIIKKTRERFGYTFYESSNIAKVILNDYRKKTQAIYLLISDQSPQVKHSLHWQEFFGIKVPFHVGAETLSKKCNLAVIYYDTFKIKRGYYKTEFKLITDNPKEFEDYQITDKYIKFVEQTIRKQPEYYLWSHKRFKHSNRFKEWENLKINKQKFKK